MSDQPFYKQVAAIDADLSEDQHHKLDVFLAEHDAIEHYKEMVAPSEPKEDEAEREQDSALRGFCIYQCIPEDKWDDFYNILGPDLRLRFDTAVEKITERFANLLG